MKGIKNTFASQGEQVKLHYVYLDAKLLRSDEYWDKLVTLISTRFSQIKFSAIIAADNDALDFVIKYRSGIFADIPVVFCGINEYGDALVAGQSLMTGVIEDVDYRGSVEIGLKLWPLAKNVVIITDNTTTGRAHAQGIKKAQQYFSEKIIFTNLNFNEYTLDEMAAKVHALPRESFILYEQASRDRLGKELPQALVGKTLAESAQFPVFVSVATRIGQGIVGGKVIGGTEQGRIASEIVLRILDGESPDKIPVVKNPPLQFMWDYSALQKWGIPLGQLPAGSVILNKPSSWLLIYKGTLAFSVFLLLVIGILSSAIRKSKKAQKALIISEEKFRAIFEQAAVGVALMDTSTGRFLRVNQRLCEIVGLTQEQITLTNFMAITHPDDLQLGLDNMEKLKRGIFRNFSIEKRYIRPNGEIIWASLTVSSMWAPGELPKFHIAIIEDITRQKVALKQLEDLNLKHSAILAAVPDIIVEVDIYKVYVWANQAAYDFFGQDMIGKEANYYFEGEQDTYKAVNSLFQGNNEIIYVESWQKRKDGQKRLLAWWCHVLKDQSGAVKGVLSSARDITEWHVAQDALRESELNLKEAQAIAKLGRWELDIDTGGLYWSDTIFTICEIDREKFGESYAAFLAIIHPEDREMVNQKYRDSIADKTPYNLEHRLLMKDGRVKWVQEICRTEYDASGKPMRSIGIVQEITERKKFEASLQKALQELERSNLELQQFAYVASHDLQEPLRMVSSYLQLLEKRYKDKLDQDANEFIYYAVNGAERLQEMILGLLNYSRVQSQDFNPENVDCTKLIKIILTNLAVLVNERKAQVTMGELPVVCGNIIQLTQLFQNLIGNALKFNDKVTFPKVHIAALKQADRWLFSVMDNGIGIEPEYKEKIFDIFQRLHGREYPGYGIGLPLCRRIVERHGGKMWVESLPGQGATFYFTLPDCSRESKRSESEI